MKDSCMRAVSLVPLLLAFGLVSPCQSPAGQTNTLESLKTAYGNERLVIAATSEDHKQDALKHYGKALEELLADLKQKGDLKSYLLVEAERKRFDATQTVPDAKDAAPASSPYAAAYQKELGASQADCDRQTAILLKKYLSALDGLISGLMKSDKIEDAKAVQEERDKAAAGLLDMDSKLPKQESTIASVPPLTKAVRLPFSLAKGLVLHYDFAKDDGDKVIDRSENHNDGKAVGATWKRDKGGNGVMKFNGQNDWIDTGANVPHYNAASFSAWVSVSKHNASGNVVAQPRKPDGTGFTLVVQGRTPHTGICYDPFYVDVRGEEIRDELFHHLVGTVGGGTVSLYVDGELVQTRQYRDTPASTSMHLLIGRGLIVPVGVEGLRSFAGELDDVMAWDRALSEQEVKQLYTLQGRSRWTGLK